MIWEYRQVLENVKKKLKLQKSLPQEDGEIDFAFLSSLERLESGKLSIFRNKLMAVFSEDPVSGDPASALEDLAAMLLNWAANIRAEKQRLKRETTTTYQIGQKIRVRLPDHFPLFIAEMYSEEEVYIPVLDKTYGISDVRIVPEHNPSFAPKADAIVMQEEVQKRLQSLGVTSTSIVSLLRGKR